MSKIMSDLVMYFSFPFVRYAMIVGILVALCSSIFGVILVLRQYSFIGDGLSHVAFLGMAIAGILNFTDNMPLILIVTIITAIILLSFGDKLFLKGDAAIAVVSVSSLGIGYLLLNIFGNSTNLSGDVCTTLFGSTSILTLTKVQVIVSIILSLFVIAFFIIFYNKIFAITFDEDFSKTIGINIRFYNILVAVIIAIIIVLSMNLVGSLLTSALIIFPALSSMCLFKSFKSVVICSAICSVISATIGILIAILFGTPVGSSIVAIEILVFIIFYILEKVR